MEKTVGHRHAKDETGNYMECKRVTQAQKEDEVDRDQAKSDLMLYMNCFEKYNNHSQSQKFIWEKLGREDEIPLKPLRQDLKNLHEVVNYPPSELSFIVEGAE